MLDTHALVWWVHGDVAKLSAAQRQALKEMEEQNEPSAISSISLWELAMLRDRNRLSTAKPLDALFEEIESHPLLSILPLSGAVAAESVRLGDDFHRDPADQIIVATARCHGLILITADDRIRKWGKVRVL